MPHLPASRALDDLTVIDMTHARAGPVCVRQLADWGANVVRIERPGNPEDFSARHEADFQNKHRNKRAMALNLRSDEGRAILYRMIEKTDVVVENFRPDVKQRLKFDYETLKSRNPRLIYASISAFGQDGPYRHRPGVDQVVQGMSGLMSVTGEPGRGPMRVGIPIADIVTGLYTALGILTALHERAKSGQGQWVQSSLLESQMFMLDLQAARYLVDGVVPQQVGNEHPSGPATNAYRTKDGYVNVAPIPSMWDRLCRALGREHWIDHPDYATSANRRNRRKQINDEVAAIAAQMDSATLMTKLDEAEVPAGPIYDIAQAYADPQAKHLKLTQTVMGVDGKEMTLPRQPFTLSRTPSKLQCRTPEFGEHTDEILVEFGFSADEIKGFRERGSVE
ncbi:MAG: CoA transferase [Hyphomicrobiales bacterium]|nr:CoA transferase [Hyphomicrobiales bacterium]